jgi:hypothetical protein
VVDDCDVVGTEPPDQILRAPVELRSACELDEGGGRGHYGTERYLPSGG